MLEKKRKKIVSDENIIYSIALAFASSLLRSLLLAEYKLQIDINRKQI